MKTKEELILELQECNKKSSEIRRQIEEIDELPLLKQKWEGKFFCAKNINYSVCTKVLEVYSRNRIKAKVVKTTRQNACSISVDVVDNYDLVMECSEFYFLAALADAIASIQKEL